MRRLAHNNQEMEFGKFVLSLSGVRRTIVMQFFDMLTPVPVQCYQFSLTVVFDLDISINFFTKCLFYQTKVGGHLKFQFLCFCICFIRKSL